MCYKACHASPWVKLPCGSTSNISAIYHQIPHEHCTDHKLPTGTFLKSMFKAPTAPKPNVDKIRLLVFFFEKGERGEVSEVYFPQHMIGKIMFFQCKISIQR